VPAALDTVHGNSAAFSRRDVEGMLACYTADAVVADRRPHGMGTFRGHAALRAYYSGIFDNADELREELEILEASEERVVAGAKLWVKLSSAAGSGDLTTEYGMVIAMRDGLIASIDLHADGLSALAATRD
jgi:ketosteroid isomerase-like protein